MPKEYEAIIQAPMYQRQKKNIPPEPEDLVDDSSLVIKLALQIFSEFLLHVRFEVIEDEFV